MQEQVIQNPHGISTFGSCVVRVEPEYATVDFTTFRIEENPADAATAARSTLQNVANVLQRRGIDERNFKAGGLTLAPSYLGEGVNAQLVGYRAELRGNVTIRALADVEAVLAAMISAGANQIDRIAYRSTRLREARAEARQGAFLAALKKAEIYGEAAGVKIGRTIHIEELNPDTLGVDLDDIDEFQTTGTYNPASIAVSAAVRVAFTLKGGKMAAATGQFVAFDP